MHETYGNAIMGSANGLPPGYQGNSPFHLPDRTALDYERLKGQSYSHPKDGVRKDRDADFPTPIKNCSLDAGARLSDTHMASRRAEEAASRRVLAVSWLQEMVGCLSLPNEPSEEEFRLCLRNGLVLCNVVNKVQPGAVPKVVENPALSSQLEGAQSAYQYFENVRNFLVAIEDMGLPSFEVSDLEQGGLSPGSSGKLVDCILGLKSYHEWKQGGGLGFWRLKSPNGSTGHTSNPGKYLTRSKSLTSYCNQARRKWGLPDGDGLDDDGMASPAWSNDMLSCEKDSRASVEGSLPSNSERFGQNGSLDGGYDVDELMSNGNTSAATSTWLQHIGHKFRDILQVKARRMQYLPTALESYGSTTVIDNAPSQSLLSLISAILGDKPAEEVPMLVEFMLRKVMEEFERHLLTQRKQVTKMKSALTDILVREEKLSSRSMVLEALAVGSGEEVKLLTTKLRQIKMEKKQVEDEKKVKQEEMDRLVKESEEKKSAVQVLKNELDYIKRLDEEHLLRLENQKREIEMESKEIIDSLEVQVKESQKKVREAEVRSAQELCSLRRKDIEYQKFLSHQALEYQDLRFTSLNAKEEVLRMQMEWRKQFSNLEGQLQGMARAASGYHTVLAENRMLYNEVQDLKGNIRVYCRVRPFLENEAGRQTTLDFIGENGELVVVNPAKQGGKEARRSFNFNKVFGTTVSQEEVFLDTQPLIRSVLDGFNVCIFAYGQTGSGKTFTMSGPSNMSEADWGVNYRALHDLFHITQSRVDVFRYEIGVQMIEIYNEQVRDLLAPDCGHKKLEIRNNSQLNGMNVPDASKLPVMSTADVLELMKLGQRNRAVGATALNERSSRSHSVLTVHVQGTDLTSGSILRGCLHLVDLAGSERVDKSEATGDRLKEAQHINKSLSALGDVIAALAQKNGHVPFRNSKLTQLLQDSLGGQAKTLMFVHISPDMESFGETVSTLKFAERVSSVELGAARSNKESGDVRDLKDQVAQLRDTVVKKDAEIERLLSLERSKVKTSNLVSQARRMSTDPSAKQRNRRLTIEGGAGNAEVRQSLRRLPGREIKHPPSLVLNTSHNSEDPTDPSSGGSPVGSPTDNQPSAGQYEGLSNLTHKLNLPKSQQQYASSRNHSSPDSEHTHLDAIQRSKSDFVLQQEAVSKDCYDRTIDNSVLAAQDSERPARFANGGELVIPDVVEPDLPCPTVAIQLPSRSINRLKAPSNGPQSANGHSAPLLEVPGVIDGQENRGVLNKRGTYMLNDVVLEEHLENGGIFDLRDGDHDDNVSIFSESCLSVDSDLLSTPPTDHNKKLQPSFGKPQQWVERRALLQTQVPRPPVRGDRKTSPVRKLSVAGQTRMRRYTNGGSVAASTENPLSKRVPSLGGKATPDPGLAGTQDGMSENSPYEGKLSRIASGGKSSKRWI